jgi:Putative adhesin
MSEQRFHTPHLRGLEIVVPAGDVAVETIDGDESFVVVDGDPKLVEQTTVELRGDKLVVDFHGKRSLLGITIAVGDFSIGGGRLHVQARVPHDVRARLATASADMNLRGRFAALETKTASGDLAVDGEIVGDAVVKTVSGDVRLDQVGGELRVQSVSGDLRARSVEGSLVAKSVSGDLRIESIRAGHAELTSISGDIEVGIATGSNVDVDANTVSGDLRSDVPLASVPGEGDGGPTVVVRGKTVSGDFKVLRAATPEASPATAG